MALERRSGSPQFVDLLDRVLDKGIVIDAWVMVSVAGIELVALNSRVVVASIETYLKYSNAMRSAPPSVT